MANRGIRANHRPIEEAQGRRSTSNVARAAPPVAAWAPEGFPSPCAPAAGFPRPTGSPAARQAIGSPAPRAVRTQRRGGGRAGKMGAGVFMTGVRGYIKNQFSDLGSRLFGVWFMMGCGGACRRTSNVGFFGRRLVERGDTVAGGGDFC